MHESSAVATPAVRTVDVAVVGGGPAGLSAALVLGRARRSVVVIDAGRAAHFAAHGVHGFLGQEDVPPRELRRRVWEQLAPFDVEHVEGEVVRGAVAPGDGDAPRVTLTLADGSVTRADFVVLAGGLRFDVQPIEGFDALWGERLFHCPFCHGWEVAGQRLAAIAPAEMVEHYAPLIGVWSDDTTPVDQGDVERVWLDGDEVVVVRRSGGVLRVDALFAPPILRAHDDLPEQLGLERAVLNPLMQHAVGVVTDPLDGSTPVPGVFAAGDLTGANPAVAIAVQSGQAAAVGIVRQYAAARAAAAH